MEKTKLICGFQLVAIEDEEPDPRKGDVILAYACGCGFRILRYSNPMGRWENDGREDRLALHNWCYLGNA